MKCFAGMRRGPTNNRSDFRAVLALPHQPLHHQVDFLRTPKPEKYELRIGLHLKSIISRIANSLMR